jgi:hypothetical protein
LFGRSLLGHIDLYTGNRPPVHHRRAIGHDTVGYDLAVFGIDPEDPRRRTHAYVERFGIVGG